MGVKYNRPDFHSSAHGMRRELGHKRESMIEAKRPPRPPRILLLSGLAVAFAIYVVGHSIGPSLPYLTQPELEGEGIVLSKQVEQAGTPEARYLLDVGVLVEEDLLLSDTVLVDKQGWDKLSERQKVRVRYKLKSDKTGVSVLGVHYAE